MSESYSIAYSGASWLYLLNGGNATKWNLKTLVKFIINPRTQKLNQSPPPSMQPLINAIAGCKKEILIPVQDPDVDIIRCRFAQGVECGDKCVMPPNSNIDSKSCILTMNVPLEIGFYAVKLQIEDFQDENSEIPMSSIPLQFLIQVNNQTDCSYKKPVFIQNDENSCKSIAVNELYTDMIIVNASSDGNDHVSEINIVAPPGVSKSLLKPYLSKNSSTLIYAKICIYQYNMDT